MFLSLSTCLVGIGCHNATSLIGGSGADSESSAHALTLGGGISNASLKLEELTNACTPNQVLSAFQVTNTGTTAVALSDISIKMWVHDTTTAQQVVSDVNYGGCATKGSSCVHQVSGVKATVAPISPACGPDANHQASWEITISTTDTSALAAGGRWTNLQTGTHLGNYATFTPGASRWFSPCIAPAGTYVSDSHYAVYYKGDLVFASGVNTPSCRGPQGTQQLTGYRTPEIAGAPLVGPVPPTTPVQLTIGLPVRNQTALKAFIQGASSPTQPATFRRFLTPEQYASTYGPLASDYQNVINWATAAGFTVTKTYPTNMLVSVRGTAATVAKALFLNLNYYSRPDGTPFYAPDREPSLNLNTTVLRVGNLENLYVPKPTVDPKTGKLLGQADIHGIYASCHPELKGEGQTIAIFSYAAYNINDVQAFQTAAGIAPADFASVSMTPVNGASTSPATGSSLAEADLDVEMALSIAPKANIIMYVSPLDQAGTNDALALIANTKPLALQVSSSWGMWVDGVTQQILDQFAAQGQSFFDASGDNGGSPYDPGHMLDLDNVTLVGGTEAIIDSTKTFVGEKAWSGSGGGILENVPLPYYQVGVPGLKSTTHRNYPDVAAFASNAEWYFNGSMYSSCCSGTSGATPIWAGFIALANQQSAANGQPPLGFINPAIYYIGQTPGYTDAFNDITEGSTPCDLPGHVGNPTYYAGTGYDLTTGWGSPACGLIDKLATPCAPSDTDPHNCGACWHDCLGGACVGGVCQPVAVTTPQSHTLGLAVDKNYIYWGNEDSVNRASLADGTIKVFTSGVGLAEYVTVNVGSVFFYDAVAMTVNRQYFVNATPTVIATKEYCYGLAVSEQQAFWTDWYRKQIATAKHPDYTKVVLASTNGYTENIKIDSENVYWTEFSPVDHTVAIGKVPIAGGTQVQLATTPLLSTAPISSGFDIDGAYVYWASDAGEINRVPIDGGATTTLATFPTTHRQKTIVVSGDIYVTSCNRTGTDDNKIVKIPAAGGTPVTVLADANYCFTLTARGPALYYTIQTSDPTPIMKLAK